MKKKTIVWSLVIAATVGSITWQALKPEDPIEVLTATAEQVEKLRAVVTATGEIRAKEFVDIQAEVAGVITELNVREGDQVKTGDVLLKLDDLQLRAEEDAAVAQVGAAEAEAKNGELGVATAVANLRAEETAVANLRVELEQASVSQERALASFQRKKQLFDGGLLGTEEYEVIDAERRLAERRYEWALARVTQGEANLGAVAIRVDAAKAMREGACRRVEAAEAALARARDLASKTVLRAPLDGLITKLNVEKGERAVPGIQSNPIATLMTIADMSVIEAQIEVDESDIVLVVLGQPAEVEVDALRDVKIQGVVTEIGQSPIQQVSSSSSSNQSNQEGKDFEVVVRLQSPPESLRPGFTATADIVTAVRESCLVIPLQALTAREVEIDDQGRYVPPADVELDTEAVLAAARKPRNEFEGVFLMQDGRARFQPIRTGITGEMEIEVLDGLKPGDIVVSGPYQVLRTLNEWDHIAVDEESMADALLRGRRKRQ